MMINIGKATLCLFFICVLSVQAKKPFDVKRFLQRVVQSNFAKKNGLSIGEIKIGCDTYDWCNNYKSYCYHPSVKQYCKGTCGNCPTTPPTTQSPSCEDKHSKCYLALERNYCKSKHPTELDFAKKYCAKSCKFCSTCKDTMPSCAGIKQYCSKDQYKTYMTKNCASTCGFCGEDEKIECGVAKRRGSQKTDTIVGGKAAKPGYYPWQVAIYYEDDFLCGGSLVGERHVLTAAHCFKHLSTDMSLYKVVMGDNNRNVNEGTEVERGVRKITQHESYKYESDTHDVAIVELAEKVKFGSDINAICLPEKDEVLKVGSKCFMSGWGKIRNDGDSVDQLQHLALPIADREHCKERNTFNNHVVNDRMICAGYNDGFNYASGCHGDSGGPIACEQTDGSWKLYGVVSWGSSQCNGLDRYTVFSRVSKYISWINGITN